MNDALKARWIAALRSGEHKQCKGHLRKVDGSGMGFCCLGVLREVIDPGSLDSGATYKTVNVLSDQHAQMCGLVASQQDRLAQMNDEGKTFAEIADYIEAKL